MVDNTPLCGMMIMNRRKIAMKKLNLIFVFFGCLCLAGCATQNNRLNKGEVWNEIESIDDFIGTWEGSAVSYIPHSVEYSSPESAFEISIVFEYKDGSERVDCTMKVDMDRFLTDVVNMLGVASGYTKDSLWEFFVEELERTERATTDGKYFVLMDLSNDDAREFFLNNDTGKFQINNNKNQVKFLYYEVVTAGLGDTGFNEIIFHKK